jgi:tetrahydromethanopterin S-methyltransferase subunit G
MSTDRDESDQAMQRERSLDRSVEGIIRDLHNFDPEIDARDAEINRLRERVAELELDVKYLNSELLRDRS